MGDEMEETAATGFLGWMLWIVQNIAMAFYNFFASILSPNQWLDWVTWTNSTEDKESLMRFIYYGGSVEFFFVAFTFFLVIFAVGVWKNGFLWGVVRGLESFANTVGRFAAWAGLLMVLQQVIIVFIQRIFTRPDISIGLGIPLQFDISWFAEELKLYNAMVVCLCLTYTFVQGGHVRVDLVYAAVSHRTKRVIDMFGSLFFMIPVAVMIWLYTWFFMWRHLVTPKVSASDGIDLLLRKARVLKWNVETIGFSPNGFTAYFLFKVLMTVMVAMIFIHAWAFFYRSYLEWKEGEESAGKFLDRDSLGGDSPAQDHATH
jgi:TRAP-type mannitol/chloroaromatic compound transport system permease small subunit